MQKIDICIIFNHICHAGERTIPLILKHKHLESNHIYKPIESGMIPAVRVSADTNIQEADKGLHIIGQTAPHEKIRENRRK